MSLTSPKKYMIQTGKRHLLREGYGKDKHWVPLPLLSRDSA
jgi:hypothetical protein